MSKVDFMTEGVSVAKLSGRILPGNFLVSLLEKAGFNRANQKEICKVIDQIGVFFTNSGFYGIVIITYLGAGKNDIYCNLDFLVFNFIYIIF